MEGPAETIVVSTPPGPADPRVDQTGPLDVGQQFSPRYLIVRLLGIGGMGAVYQAWDADLGVMVALKVIRPEVTRDPTAAREIERRFKQELLLARQVTHRNVVRIHDMGEIDGIKYITMPYIEGDDLATVLEHSGPVPVARVMTIARQIASGLQAAHDAGVVHRDLKPANIMIAKDAEAIIMDFGIARTSSSGGAAPVASQPLGAVSEALSDQVTRIAATSSGAIVGTVEYMAPEQARGQEVDQRADLYAFGLILYDMLAGTRRATHAGSALADLQKRLEQPPPSIKSLRHDLPEPLSRFVSRCVEPDPARRFASTGEMRAALARLDDAGRLRPIRRAIGLPLAAAIAAVLLALVGYTYWSTRPPVQHDPMSIVIADFANRTSDPAFDQTLEPMIKRALEGASFISAYDRDAIRRTLGVQPPDRLDENAARSLAVNQGLGAVLAGSIEPQRGGYAISVHATQAVTGESLASAQARASSKDQVIDVAMRLVTRVRRALGDETSASAQMFAMASLSATSLDVVRLWVDGRNAASRNDYDEAMRDYSRAVELDPKFGLGYAGLANVSSNRANQQDAEKYITEALRYVDGMTERERFTTRAGYYRLTGDYRQCVKEYNDLLAAYPADVAAHNNLAICLAYLRDFAGAEDSVRKVVEMLPNRAMYRVNLASFANFSSDFRTGESEAGKLEKPDVNALIAVAFAELGQNRRDEAKATYEKVGAISDYGTSLAASGLAELANLAGHFSDAARLLDDGVAEDLKQDHPDWAAAKLAALAHTEILRGRPGAAVDAADRALANDDGLNVRFMAARAYVAAGRIDKARPLMAAMAAELLAEPQAYAKIVEGEIALANGDPRQAVKVLTDANTLLDTWLGHFDLGRAYFEAGQLPQADSEFDKCLRRRGEALQLILGDEPTYTYLAPVFYYQGRVRQAMGTDAFADSYRQYLDIRGNSTEDPLVKEIRERVGG
jgi:tetratricopeptide (TPR) repeat protein/tRNA A-37 threonylcarbamoyl transferase component Bud32